MANDTRETRLRRAAHRQGLQLVKSRRKDQRAIGYGKFAIVERHGKRAIGAVPGGFALRSAPATTGGLDRYAAWLSLDGIERLLRGALPMVAGDI